ncbi:transcription repressor OFP8-like [Zingiber officinale]|uniref:Transcription repressor n=1 Tax=Zingiber officinale TaxID=94328 RepID=A0A8J5LGE4_ZINOF|nr:transcription repressor OFP8-like [Zingiber officinale]KAG6514367.1 hypothetical protein ZIOFF_024720 [Zingiber officinale]
MGAKAFGRRSSSFPLFSFGCGACSDSKSVSVSATKPASPRSGGAVESSADTPLSLAATLSSSYHDDEEGTPASVSELLLQLGELERSVVAWSRGGERRQSRGVEDSVVVVVRDTKNPTEEFRRSMLHMIVEKEIVGGAELQELLRRFLALNSPRYHATILCAFAEIWEDVFAGYERTPDFLRRSYSDQLPLGRLH